LRISNFEFLIFRRQVTFEEGEKLAKDNGLMFLETSAKSSYNVEESFNLSSQMILSNMEKNKSPYEEKVNVI
jgi:Ras-related protein Rab-2A